MMKLQKLVKEWVKEILLNVEVKSVLFKLIYFNPKTVFCGICELKRKTGLLTKFIIFFFYMNKMFMLDLKMLSVNLQEEEFMY